MNDLIFSMITIVSALVLGLVIYFVVSLIFKKESFKITLGSLVFEPKTAIIPLIILIPCALELAVIPWLRISADILSAYRHLLIVILILSVSWLFISLINIVRNTLFLHYNVQQQKTSEARSIYTKIHAIGNLTVFVIIFIAIAVILTTFPAIKNLGVSLLASAGVLGVIIGFAAQKILGNLIAGIQVAITQPIKLEDAVIVEGEWGWVEEIGFTYVVVRIWDLRRLIVPISYFIDKPFQNWTRNTANLLGSIYIYADYNLPVNEMRQQLAGILKDDPNWDGKVNQVQVTNAGEKAIELRALVSSSDSSKLWNLRCTVREKLLFYLQKNYPSCLPHARIEIENIKRERE